MNPHDKLERTLNFLLVVGGVVLLSTIITGIALGILALLGLLS